MKLTILGASGRIGTELVHQASDAGHRVTAVLRTSSTCAPSSPACAS